MLSVHADGNVCSYEQPSQQVRLFERCLASEKLQLQWTTCRSSAIFQSLISLENQPSNNTPYAFILPKTISDVSVALHCSNVVGLPFTIRGGGHSYVAASLLDRGVVIDMKVSDWCWHAYDSVNNFKGLAEFRQHPNQPIPANCNNRSRTEAGTSLCKTRS